MVIEVSDDCSEDDRKVWCLAWRMLQRHGAAVDQVIESELERCLAQRDATGASHWRQVADAVEALRE